MPLPLSWVRRLGRDRLPAKLAERLEQLHFADLGHGFDAFGANREWVALGLATFRALYESYFRVRSYGAENIPRTGPVIVAANHSGTLPFDATMLFWDILRQTNPPRLPRPVADRFVPKLPFVGTFFARVGVVTGLRYNVRSLLERGELLMVFPEGTPGIGKSFGDRYRLQYWREGHVELAIRFGAPVLPAAVIGAEEQMPQLARVDGFHPFGVPYLPLPLTLLPLPVRYHIHYGAPIPLHEWYTPAQADDPLVLTEAALEVKDAVRALIARGLSMRSGVFS